MAMDRDKWENTFACFQAYARGYLVRHEVRRAREDFEDIVKEIDGDLSHLQWRHTAISTPHFTDTYGPFLPGSSSASQPSEAGLNVRASSQTSSAEADTCLSHARGRDQHVLEKTEAERDDSQAKDHGCLSNDCFPSIHAEEDRGQTQKSEREQQGDNDGGMMESTGDSTSVWSSLDLGTLPVHSQKGSQQFCLAQDVPRTPEALRLHRNTLTMELVWLQQAIDSRKKYLSLKDRLSIS